MSAIACICGGVGSRLGYIGLLVDLLMALWGNGQNDFVVCAWGLHITLNNLGMGARLSVLEACILL